MSDSVKTILTLVFSGGRIIGPGIVMDIGLHLLSVTVTFKW